MKTLKIQFNFRAESDTHSDVYLSLSDSEANLINLSLSVSFEPKVIPFGKNYKNYPSLSVSSVIVL